MSWEVVINSVGAISAQVGALVLGCFGLGFLIAFHEFGHYLFCKLFGVRTPTFSIGFGPRLIERKLGDTVFTLSLIPLGGFVEIAGHEEVGQGDQAEAQRSDEASFAHKPYLQKMAIMGGGILCNMLFAYGALVFLARYGVPASQLLYPGNAQPVVARVIDGSPAAQAGILPQDRIIAIESADGSVSHGVVTDLLGHIRKYPASQQKVIVERNGERQDLAVTIGEQQHCGERIGVLGAVFTMEPEAPTTWSRSFGRAYEILADWTSRTVKSFRSMWERKSLDSVGGPLAVIVQTIKGAQGGFALYILLLAFISLNLALMNLIPVPVFDGGQALLVTIEAIVRRKLPESLRISIHYATWVLLLGLIGYLTYCDLHSLKALWALVLAPIGYVIYRLVG